MIEKFRRIQNSWAIKVILVLTALSFMSLFGISGYVNSATTNKAVVNVDGTKISANEIAMLFNKDISIAQRFLGQNLNLSEDAKKNIINDIIIRETNNLIINKTAQNKGIAVSENLLKNIIQSQSQFADKDGNFDFNLFQKFLAMSYQTQDAYINNLVSNIEKQILVSDVISGVQLPKTYDNYLNKAASIKKVVEYIKIEPTKLSVDRTISQDELEQYYTDYAADFMASETRDASYIFIKAPSDDFDVNADFADEIEDTIGGGTPFEELAKTYKAKIVNLTKIAEDGSVKNAPKTFKMTSDFIDSVFSYNEEEISNVIESENGFYVVRINKITPEYQKEINTVKNDIIKLWKKDEQLAIAQEIASDVNNDIEAGDNLTEIAHRFKLNLKTTKALLKNETFEELTALQMQQVFNDSIGNINTVETPNAKILAVVKKVIKGNVANKDNLNKLKESLSSEATQNLINSYGQDLNVKTNYENI